MTKPDVKYIVTRLLYSQKVVAEALGISIKKNEILRINCDGDNKLTIELYRSPYRRYKRQK